LHESLASADARGIKNSVRIGIIEVAGCSAARDVCHSAERQAQPGSSGQKPNVVAHQQNQESQDEHDYQRNAHPRYNFDKLGFELAPSLLPAGSCH